MRKVLMVCTGNICRSPMAAALLQAQLNEDRACHDWEVHSAGTRALSGRHATAYAIAEMEERGLDISGHRSRQLDTELLNESDLVLVMTRRHQEAISAMSPDQAQKVYLLSKMVGSTYDIEDPYGGSRLVYSYVAREIAQLIEEGYDKIVSLAD